MFFDESEFRSDFNIPATVNLEEVLTENGSWMEFDMYNHQNVSDLSKYFSMEIDDFLALNATVRETLADVLRENNEIFMNY